MSEIVPAPTVRPPSRIANLQTLLHRDRRDQLDLHRDVVARHHHLHSFRQIRHPGHVRRSEVELWTISGEERRVPPSLFLRQHVGFRLELRVRLDAPGLRDHLPALDLLALNSAQQQPHVVSRAPLIEQLLEHLDSRHHRRARVLDPDDLYRLAYLHDSSLDPARRHRSAT